MTKLMAAFAVAFLLVALANPAEAKYRHHHYRHHFHHRVYDANWNLAHKSPVVRYSRHVHRQVASGFNEAFLSHSAGDGVIAGRPSGCPHAFCGCEASRYLFGRIIPDLNLAANWLRKFPRASPAPGMAAARNHHVFVLISHVGGSNWLVHDGNSGGHLTREHVRSISGYTVVNPHGGRMAMNL